MSKDGLKIFGGQAGKPLAEEVARLLFTEVGDATVGRFADGEVKVQLGLGEGGNVRGQDVFIVNPTHMPHDNIFDLLALTDAVRRSRPRLITLVVPYLAYNRQDRKDKPRSPITTAVMQRMLARSGADGILLLDMHSEATEAVFDPLKVDHLYASVLAIPYFQSLLQEQYVVGAPDHGATGRARGYAKRLGKPGDWVVFDKDRSEAGRVSGVTLIGSVENKDVILVDDMIDTGGTLIKVAESAKLNGARKVYAFATHALFSKDSIQRLDACDALDQLIVTDTIRHAPEKLITGRLPITVLPIAPLIAQAINAIHTEASISKLIL